MSRTGGDVACLIALIPKQHGGNYTQRSQGTMVHRLLTSAEVHSKYISSHTGQVAKNSW